MYRKFWTSDIIPSKDFKLAKYKGKNEEKCKKILKEKLIISKDIYLGKFKIERNIQDYLTCEFQLDIQN